MAEEDRRAEGGRSASLKQLEEEVRRIKRLVAAPILDKATGRRTKRTVSSQCHSDVVTEWLSQGAPPTAPRYSPHPQDPEGVTAVVVTALSGCTDRTLAVGERQVVSVPDAEVGHADEVVAVKVGCGIIVRVAKPTAEGTRHRGRRATG